MGRRVIAFLTLASDGVSSQLHAPASLTPVSTEYEVHGKWDKLNKAFMNWHILWVRVSVQDTITHNVKLEL